MKDNKYGNPSHGEHGHSEHHGMHKGAAEHGKHHHEGEMCHHHMSGAECTNACHEESRHEGACKSCN